MIEFEVKLLGELRVEGLNNLAHLIMQTALGWWELLMLVDRREWPQNNALSLGQFRRHGRAKEGFIAQDLQIGMSSQQFLSHCHVAGMGWGQAKIKHQAVERHPQMQFVANGGSRRGPIACRGRHQRKLDHWHRQTVDDTLMIKRPIQHRQNRLADQVEGVHQGVAVIEPTLRGKQIPMLTPIAHHLRFHIPLPTFPHQRHGQQLTITTTGRGWPRTLKRWGDLVPNIIHQPKSSKSSIIMASLARLGSGCNLNLIQREIFCLSQFI